MRIPSRSARVLTLVIGVLAGRALAPAQDSLQLTDGRFLTGPKMTRTADGVLVHCSASDVLVPKSLVKESSVTAVEGEQLTLSAEDQEKIKKGLVNFEGKWVRASVRDARIRKRADAIKDHIAEAMEHSKWANKYNSQSRYFDFHYTIDPDILQRWADLMDAYYKTFSKFWGGIRPPAGFDKLEVKFYHNHDYYDQVTGMAGTGGFFRFVPPLELNFYYDRLDEDWTLNVMFHETNHYLTWLIEPKYKYPVWINEGLAEYYGASVWDPDKKTLEVGGLLEGRLANVQQDILEDNWLGLDEMIKIPHSSFGGQYYGWAWLFVHFMLHTDYEKKFKKMFRAMPNEDVGTRERLEFPGWSMTQHTPDSVEIIMKKYLKVNDLKDLEKEWHEYIKGMQPSSGRGYYQFGRTALRDGMPIKATKMFEKAEEMGYDAPALYVDYARALTDKPKKDSDLAVADYKLAVEQYEKALAMDPINPLFRAGYARLLDRAAKASKTPNPEVEKQRRIAQELADCVDGGQDSYSVFLALDWKIYEGEGD